MISNIHKNIMGTISFDGQFGKMRKAQDFIVYPCQDAGSVIKIQSDHRFGYLDLANGVGILSANRAQYANGQWLSFCRANGTAEPIALDETERETLRAAIRSTGGLLVGESFVKCENIGAFSV